jgi:hypothetical protein
MARQECCARHKYRREGGDADQKQSETERNLIHHVKPLLLKSRRSLRQAKPYHDTLTYKSEQM